MIRKEYCVHPALGASVVHGIVCGGCLCASRQFVIFLSFVFVVLQRLTFAVQLLGSLACLSPSKLDQPLWFPQYDVLLCTGDSGSSCTAWLLHSAVVFHMDLPFQVGPCSFCLHPTGLNIGNWEGW